MSYDRCASQRCKRVLTKPGKYCDRYCLSDAKTDTQTKRIREQREHWKRTVDAALAQRRMELGL